MSITIYQTDYNNLKPLIKCTFIKNRFIWIIEVFSEYDNVLNDDSEIIGFNIHNYKLIEMSPDVIYKYIDYIFNTYKVYIKTIEVIDKNLNINLIGNKPSEYIKEIMEIMHNYNLIIKE